MTPSSSTAITPDAECAAAISLARRAITDSLDEVAKSPSVPDAHVGEHRGVSADFEGSAIHHFQCLAPGYVGWNWVVTLVRVRGGSPTIADVVLLPADGALLAPEWTPWSERIRPGDLGVGDVLPTPKDDVRLTPGYTGEGDRESVTDADAVREVVWELGLGRERVLSAEGRDDAMFRWYAGDFGPDAPMAKAAPANCNSCGFLMHVGGSAGRVFGVCANEMSPADGRVVSLEFGCGAHSEVVAPEHSPVDVVDLVINEVAYDLLSVDRVAPTDGEAKAEQAEDEAGDTDFEPVVQAELVETAVEDHSDDSAEEPQN